MYRILDSTEFYDESSGQWKLGPPLPHPMRSFVAIAKSETEVLFFGALISPTGDATLGGLIEDKVLLFDVTTG